MSGGIPARHCLPGLLAVLLLGFLIIPVSRLPQLLGAPVFPDGDEAIVGLMAKHMAEGKDVPFFFYGQAYGLSFFEVGAAAIAFRLFGVSNLALKGAELLLWSVGWMFYVLGAHRWAGKRAAGLAAVALIVCPAWAGLSMKAFGGIVTAFAFMGVLVWLCARLVESPAQRAWIGMGTLGAVAGIILLAQPLWFPPTVPFMALVAYRRRRLTDAAALAAGLAVIGLCYVLTLETRSTYWSPDILRRHSPLTAVLHLPERIWVVMSGAYWMGDRLPSGPFTALAATLWGVLWLGAAVTAVVQWRRGVRVSPLAASVIAVVIAMGVSLALDDAHFQYRYLSAATAPLVFGVALSLASWFDRGRRAWWGAASCVTALVLAGALSLAEFGKVDAAGMTAGPGYTLDGAFAELLAVLRQDGVRYVYSTDPMLQWSIMFASKEDVTARWVHPSDRVPEYPAAVDRALRAGQRVAVVGWAHKRRAQLDRALSGTGQSISIVANTFSLVLDPDAAVVRRLGFQLND